MKLQEHGSMCHGTGGEKRRLSFVTLIKLSMLNGAECWAMGKKE